VINDETQAAAVASDIFKKLFAISDARKKLSTYRLVHKIKSF